MKLLLLFFIIKLQVKKDVVETIKAKNLVGVVFSENNSRSYPYNEMLTQVLGFTTIDNVGQAGIELYADKYLKGTNKIYTPCMEEISVDEILKETGNLFLGTKDLNQAEKTAEESLKLFEDIANRVIKEEGFDYKATVSLGDQFFETRHYETFSLPAGTYRSLIVKLGKAEGKNWWCVIFPSICVPTSSSDLRQSVSENSAKIAEHSEKYIVRFKIVEIYEKLKRALS